MNALHKNTEREEPNAMTLTAKFVCSGCRWWQFYPAEGSDPNSQHAVGYCRRFPPTRRENGAGAWPITFGNDWCGEYADKSEAAIQISRGVSPAH
jgi:hypothetical protein